MHGNASISVKKMKGYTRQTCFKWNKNQTLFFKCNQIHINVIKYIFCHLLGGNEIRSLRHSWRRYNIVKEIDRYREGKKASSKEFKYKSRFYNQQPCMCI